MNDIVYWCIMTIVWSVRRVLQLISIGLLVYWVGLLIYLFFNGLGPAVDTIELIAFVIVFIGPMVLAPLCWWLSELLRFDD